MSISNTLNLALRFYNKHKSASTTDEFAQLSRDMGAWGKMHPDEFTRDIIVALFNQIERAFVENGKN